MNKLIKLNAKVKSFNGTDYHLLTSEGLPIIISYKVMHNNCDFNDFTNNQGVIKNGSMLHLVGFLRNGNYVFYPDHKCYHKKERSQSKFYSSVEDCHHVPNITASKPNPHNVQPNYATVNIPSRENTTTEFKQSFQRKEEIIQTATAFANAKLAGRIFVGVAPDGNVKGVDFKYNEKSYQEQFETSFRNQFKLRTRNRDFAHSLKFSWIKHQGKLICIIFVPKWEHEVILFDEKDLYVRMNQSNEKLNGYEMINFIKAS